MLGKFLEWLGNEHQEVPVVPATSGLDWKAYERCEHERGFAEEDGSDDGSVSVYRRRGQDAHAEHEHEQSCRQLKW